MSQWPALAMVYLLCKFKDGYLFYFIFIIINIEKGDFHHLLFDCMFQTV